MTEDGIIRIDSLTEKRNTFANEGERWKENLLLRPDDDLELLAAERYPGYDVRFDSQHVIVQSEDAVSGSDYAQARGYTKGERFAAVYLKKKE